MFSLVWKIKRGTFNKETVSLRSFGCSFVFSSLAAQKGINNASPTLREADFSLVRDVVKNKVFCRRTLLHTLLWLHRCTAQGLGSHCVEGVALSDGGNLEERVVPLMEGVLASNVAFRSRLPRRRHMRLLFRAHAASARCMRRACGSSGYSGV